MRGYTLKCTTRLKAAISLNVAFQRGWCFRPLLLGSGFKFCSSKALSALGVMIVEVVLVKRYIYFPQIGLQVTISLEGISKKTGLLPYAT